MGKLGEFSWMYDKSMEWHMFSSTFKDASIAAEINQIKGLVSVVGQNIINDAILRKVQVHLEYYSRVQNLLSFRCTCTCREEFVVVTG